VKKILARALLEIFGERFVGKKFLASALLENFGER